MQVIRPHAPLRDATALANNIQILADRPGLAAVRLSDDNRVEVALLNPEGESVKINAGPSGIVATNAKAAYLLLRDGWPT